MGALRKELFVWLVLASTSLLVAVLAVAAPVSLSQGHVDFASAIYKAFSFLCHQIPERSFYFEGHQFAVCSRCTGLYAGFAIAALVYPLVRPLKRTETPGIIWLILAVIPLTIDFALTYLGIWQNNHLSRFSTGAVLGVVAAFYVVPGLIELSSTIWRRFKSEPPAVASG